MSRNLRDTSDRLFGKLIEFARLRGMECEAASRWFKGTDDERNRAANLRVVHKLEFSRYRAMVHLILDEHHMIGLIGFDCEELDSIGALIESDIDGPEIFVLLAETNVAPSRRASEIVNIVGSSSSTDAGYEGHDPAAIQGLFPNTRLLSAPGGVDDETVWPLFLGICAMECAQGNSWMDLHLTTALRELASVSMERFPYQALCRSVFDMDPRSLFLAIYRCLEAAYAYDACSRLRDELNTELSWFELAKKLADTLSWYPKQSNALSAVLAYVPSDQLQEICESLGHEVGESAAISASNAITRVRNRIVHFGPTTQSIEVDSYDWNRVCAALVGLVTAVHTVAFLERKSAEPASI